MQKVFTVFLLWTLAGCSHVVIQTGSTASPVPSTSIKLHSFVWGFIPKTLPSESQLCPNGKVNGLDLRMTGNDVLVSIVTLGIYVPHHVQVSCSETKVFQ